jgi:hypothetical protein
VAVETDPITPHHNLCLLELRLTQVILCGTSQDLVPTAHGLGRGTYPRIYTRRPNTNTNTPPTTTTQHVWSCVWYVGSVSASAGFNVKRN